MKSNLLFNRRKPGGGIGSGTRNKFGKISSIVGQQVSTTTTTTESSTDSEDVATTTAPTQETEEEEEEEGEKRPNIASRFKPSSRRPFGGVRPGLGFPRPPISFTNALLAKRKLRGGKKVEVETKQEEEEEVTTVAPPSTSTVFTAFGSSSSSLSSSSSSSSSPTSSVAEELFSDDESISNEIEPEAKPFAGPRNILAGFRKPRKWPSVKKAKVCQRWCK